MSESAGWCETDQEVGGRVARATTVRGSGSSARIPTPACTDDATLTAARAPAGNTNMCHTSFIAKRLSSPACLATVRGACGVIDYALQAETTAIWSRNGITATSPLRRMVYPMWSWHSMCRGHTVVAIMNSLMNKPVHTYSIQRVG